MGLWKTINIALIALKLNALRSFLTMLGIIIGIASVIVMVSVMVLSGKVGLMDLFSSTKTWKYGRHILMSRYSTVAVSPT